MHSTIGIGQLYPINFQIRSGKFSSVVGFVYARVGFSQQLLREETELENFHII